MAFYSEPKFGSCVDARRKIVDAGFNLSGNSHDSRSMLWCKSYDHIMAILDGHIIACNPAFMKSGKLSSKIMKLKDNTLEN